MPPSGHPRDVNALRCVGPTSNFSLGSNALHLSYIFRIQSEKTHKNCLFAYGH